MLYPVLSGRMYRDSIGNLHDTVQEAIEAEAMIQDELPQDILQMHLATKSPLLKTALLEQTNPKYRMGTWVLRGERDEPEEVIKNYWDYEYGWQYKLRGVDGGTIMPVGEEELRLAEAPVLPEDELVGLSSVKRVAAKSPLLKPAGKNWNVRKRLLSQISDAWQKVSKDRHPSEVSDKEMAPVKALAFPNPPITVEEVQWSWKGLYDEFYEVLVRVGAVAGDGGWIFDIPFLSPIESMPANVIPEEYWALQGPGEDKSRLVQPWDKTDFSKDKPSFEKMHQSVASLRTRSNGPAQAPAMAAPSVTAPMTSKPSETEEESPMPESNEVKAFRNPKSKLAFLHAKVLKTSEEAQQQGFQDYMQQRSPSWLKPEDKQYWKEAVEKVGWGANYATLVTVMNRIKAKRSQQKLVNDPGYLAMGILKSVGIGGPAAEVSSLDALLDYLEMTKASGVTSVTLEELMQQFEDADIQVAIGDGRLDPVGVDENTGEELYTIASLRKKAGQFYFNEITKGEETVQQVLDLIAGVLPVGTEIKGWKVAAHSPYADNGPILEVTLSSGNNNLPVQFSIGGYNTQEPELYLWYFDLNGESLQEVQEEGRFPENNIDVAFPWKTTHRNGSYTLKLVPGWEADVKKGVMSGLQEVLPPAPKTASLRTQARDLEDILLTIGPDDEDPGLMEVEVTLRSSGPETKALVSEALTSAGYRFDGPHKTEYHTVGTWLKKTKSGVQDEAYAIEECLENLGLQAEVTPAFGDLLYIEVSRENAVEASLRTQAMPRGVPLRNMVLQGWDLIEEQMRGWESVEVPAGSPAGGIELTASGEVEGIPLSVEVMKRPPREDWTAGYWYSFKMGPPVNASWSSRVPDVSLEDTIKAVKHAVAREVQGAKKATTSSLRKKAGYNNHYYVVEGTKDGETVFNQEVEDQYQEEFIAQLEELNPGVEFDVSGTSDRKFLKPVNIGIKLPTKTASLRKKAGFEDPIYHANDDGSRDIMLEIIDKAYTAILSVIEGKESAVSLELYPGMVLNVKDDGTNFTSVTEAEGASVHSHSVPSSKVKRLAKSYRIGTPAWGADGWMVVSDLDLFPNKPDHLKNRLEDVASLHKKAARPTPVKASFKFKVGDVLAIENGKGWDPKNPVALYTVEALVQLPEPFGPSYSVASWRDKDGPMGRAGGLNLPASNDYRLATPEEMVHAKKQGFKASASLQKRAASPTLYSLVDRTLEQSGKILMPGQKDVLVNYLMSTFPAVADEEGVKQAILDWLTNKQGAPSVIEGPAAGPAIDPTPTVPITGPAIALSRIRDARRRLAARIIAATSSPIDAVRVELARAMADVAAAQGKLIEIEDPSTRSEVQAVIRSLNDAVNKADQAILGMSENAATSPAEAGAATAPATAPVGPKPINTQEARLRRR